MIPFKISDKKDINIPDDCPAFEVALPILLPKDFAKPAANGIINIAKIASPNDFVTSSRYNLLQILQQKYLDLGGEVLYDHKYKSINQDEVKITFANNLEYEVSHILACDGINSSVREEFFPMNGPAIYSGYQAWRGIGKAQQTEAKFYFSKGKHIVSYPLNNKGEVSFTAVVKNCLLYTSPSPRDS